jgi:hypothetical protein
MAYRTTGQVNYNGKLIAPGKPISFSKEDDSVRDELLEAGAIVEVKTNVEPSAAGENAELTLSKMTKAALVVVANKEGGTLTGQESKAELVAIIEAKRAELANNAADEQSA